jgi:adenylate cyclase
VALDDSLPLAHARLGWAYFATRRHKEAMTEGRRAVALGPNDAESHAQLGNLMNWTGNPEEGIVFIKKAMRLNPNYPYYYLFYLGHSYYLMGNNGEAIQLMNRVVTRAPYFLPVRRHLAVLFQEIGMKKEARAQVKEVLRIFPAASIEDERQRCYYMWTPALQKRFFTGLRKSGMPEGRRGEELMSMD